MKKKNSTQRGEMNLPVSKQTAGGVAGAIIGGVIGGPVGAVAGAIAGTMMGNRAAEGKTLVSPTTVKTAREAVQAVKQKLPSPKSRAVKSQPGTILKPAKSKSRKRAAAQKTARKSSPKKL